MSHIPELPHHCNSWVVVRKDTGEVIGEFHERSNVEKFNPEKVRILTAAAYLGEFNSMLQTLKATSANSYARVEIRHSARGA